MEVVKLAMKDGSYETNPVKAIRAKCLDCSGGDRKEVSHCPITKCPLYPFREGKNPYRTPRTMSEEQKEKQRSALAKARSSGRQKNKGDDLP